MRKEEMEDLSFIRYMGISIFIIIFIVLMILLSGELLRQEKTLQKRIKKNINVLAQGAVAAQSSNALANKVEFWKWMDRNYAGSGIFSSKYSSTF